jgi:hypothetical protein
LGVTFDGEKTSGLNTIRNLPNPGICSARPAKWPGTFFCLVHDPTQCKHVRYFNEVAYCIHPKREAIIAKTKAGEGRRSGDSN